MLQKISWRRFSWVLHTWKLCRTATLASIIALSFHKVIAVRVSSPMWLAIVWKQLRRVKNVSLIMWTRRLPPTCCNVVCHRDLEILFRCSCTIRWKVQRWIQVHRSRISYQIPQVQRTTWDSVSRTTRICIDLFIIDWFVHRLSSAELLTSDDWAALPAQVPWECQSNQGRDHSRTVLSVVCRISFLLLAIPVSCTAKENSN